jgi:hypothetical protein
LETSSAVTSGLKRETNSALNLSGCLTTGSDGELLTPKKVIKKKTENYSSSI